MLRKICLILPIVLNGLLFKVNAQHNSQYLKDILDSTRKERNDSVRIALNQVFFLSLKSFIELTDFHPDSLKLLQIGKSVASDGKFIFYNWNIQQNDGSNLYNGIIFMEGSKKIIPLPISQSETTLDNDSVYEANNWPPALYYKVISPRKKSDQYYLLFGWDPFSRKVSRKSVEAIYFPTDTTVIFGRQVFKTKEGKAKRLVFEYAATANFTLKYSKQKLTLTGVRKRYRNVNDSLIIIDRLAPLNPELEGIRWAYVPVGNIYDGYLFFNNYWTFVEGINARNPALKGRERSKFKKPEMDLIPKK